MSRIFCIRCSGDGVVDAAPGTFTDKIQCPTCKGDGHLDPFAFLMSRASAVQIRPEGRGWTITLSDDEYEQLSRYL
jgi:DnaJ-class molecular chaperone